MKTSLPSRQTKRANLTKVQNASCLRFDGGRDTEIEKFARGVLSFHERLRFFLLYEDISLVFFFCSILWQANITPGSDRVEGGMSL